MPCYCTKIAQLVEDEKTLREILDIMDTLPGDFERKHEENKSFAKDFFSAKRGKHYFRINEIAKFNYSIDNFMVSLPADIKNMGGNISDTLSTVSADIAKYNKWDEEHHEEERIAAEAAKSASSPPK